MKIQNSKFKIQNYFIIILFFAIFNSSAQVPGYLGKRFVVSVSLTAFPKIFYNENLVDYFGKKQGSYDNVLNKQLGVSLGYIVSRFGIISLDYEHLSGGFQKYVYINYDYRFPFTYQFSGNGYGIEYTKFDAEKGALAPLGNYTRYQFQNLIVQVSDSINLIKKISVSNINYPVFAMVFGRQAILFDNIYYDIGARVGLVLRHASYFAGKGDFELNTIEDRLSVRIRDQQLFNFFLRIGYLF